MNYYYVKLSCPAEIGDPKFENILESCKNKLINHFTLTNIPNHIEKLNQDDLIIIILSGDANDKRRVLKAENSDFTNGIYAIARAVTIRPSVKEIDAEFYPLKDFIDREQLYFYPQFTDNLGGMTKGAANQAGLYELDENVFYSLINYLILNNLINNEYSFFDWNKTSNSLQNNIKNSNLFAKAKNYPSFKEINTIFQKTNSDLIVVSDSASEFIIQEFCKWSKNQENNKISYNGLIESNYLNFLNECYFSNELFSFDPNHPESEKLRIKNLIKNKLTDEKWLQFNESTSKGAPRAIIGDNNYLKFLDEFTERIELFEKYKSIYKKLNLLIKDTNYNILAKPFVILAGISGTGKTRFIREQAKKTGRLDLTYKLVPVRPDWHEPSDVIGYVSRLGGFPKYIVTDVLRFVVTAWVFIYESGLFKFKNGSVEGNINSLSQIPPFWLCFDEMNLAPVEQYFSDYLSVIETREWRHKNDQFEYSCDPLIQRRLLKELNSELRNDLDLGAENLTQLWEYFCEVGIPLPFNLVVAGTVNMDETTHGFSRKVLDRALTFEFDEFFPNEFENYFKPISTIRSLTYPIWSDGRSLNELEKTIDRDGNKTINFLNAINNILDNSSFKLAFRALNEILLTVISIKPQSEIELQSVWDDFIIFKVLPRIEGDLEKLTIITTDDKQTNILVELENVLAKQLELIWESGLKIDFYRTKEITIENSEKINNNNLINIACRSKKKITWMRRRLANQNYISFWP